MRRLRRNRAKQKLRDAVAEVDGPCSTCGKPATVKHECITCADSGIAPSKRFAALGCRDHAAEALTAIKRHCLTAHPVNLLRATVAALRGEDIE